MVRAGAPSDSDGSRVPVSVVSSTKQFELKFESSSTQSRFKSHRIRRALIIIEVT